jgi:uroporphyrinogen-III decarboxylase
MLNGMGRVRADLVDLDYLVPVSLAREAMGPAQPLLGNLEPVGLLRDSTVECVRAAVARCHAEAGAAYVVGAGCEICRDTPEANLRAMCEYARQAH